MKHIFKFFSRTILLVFLLTQPGLSTPSVHASSADLVFEPVFLSRPEGWREGSLNGVWGTAANNVYAVGDFSTGDKGTAAVYHNNGSSWQVIGLPTPSGWSKIWLSAVWGSSANDVYAVGLGIVGTITNLPLIYHYDGSTWKASSPNLPAGWTNGRVNSVWGSSASDVYAVGIVYTQTKFIPAIYHYDGSKWKSFIPSSMPQGWTPGGMSQFYSVWGSSASDVYVVGSAVVNHYDAPLIYHYDGSSWKLTIPSLPGGWYTAEVNGIWGSSASDIYVVGTGWDQFADMDKPLIYHYDGSSWETSILSLPNGWTEDWLAGVWGSSASDVYAVAGDVFAGAMVSIIYHYNGSSWKPLIPSMSSEDRSGLSAVWGSSATNVYAVGGGGINNIYTPLIYHGKIASEHLLNGRFESYAGSSLIPEYWRETSFSKTDGKNTTNVKGGSASIQISNGKTAVNKTLSQTIALSGGKGNEIMFSFWVMGLMLPSPGNCMGQILLYNGTALVGTDTINCTSGSYAFRRMVQTFTAPSAYTSVAVKFTYSKSNSTVWFDEASLMK